MALNINEIRSHLALGGARPTHFYVQITNLVNAAGDVSTPFLFKGAQLPGLTLGTIEIPYFGRKIKIAGDRTYEPWTTTVINDETFLIRNSIEQWNHAINPPVTNVRQFRDSVPEGYKSIGHVHQVSKNGLVIRSYKFHGLWPSEVSPIELSWESVDQVEEFTVTWQYDWWEIGGGLTGSAGSQDSSGLASLPTGDDDET